MSKRKKLKLDDLSDDASSAGGKSPIDPEPLVLDQKTKEVMANEAELGPGPERKKKAS